MKRMFSKVLVCLLVISILFTGMGDLLPEAAQDIYRMLYIAAAERAALPEAFSLEEQPLGQEYTSGEWRYALREGDGYAVITGYSGSAASSLQVPASIDGEAVVGIAGGALDIPGLQSAALNGRIMYIADDAFGSAQPVIHALNGSYALYWADARGLSYVNETEGHLMPGVIDFYDAPSGSVSCQGESHVVFSHLDAMRVQPGSLIWFKDARDLQYIYRVTELTHERRFSVAAVEVPEVYEGIVEMHHSGVIKATAADFIPADEFADEYAASTYDIYHGEDSDEVYFPKFSLFANEKLEEKNAPAEEGRQAKVEISVDGSLYGTVYYRYDIVDGETVYAETITETTQKMIFSLKGGFQWTKTLKKAGDKFIPLEEMDLPKFDDAKSLGKFIMGGTLVQMKFEVRFKYEFTGAISDTVVVNDIQHMVYTKDSGEWELVDRDQDIDTCTSLSFDGKFCLEVLLTIAIIGVFSIAQASVEAGVKGKLEVPIASTQLMPECLNLTITPYVQFRVFAGVWFEFDGWVFGGKGEIYNSDKDPNNKVKKHLDQLAMKLHIHHTEGIHKAMDCPLSNRVAISFDTRIGSKISAVKGCIGQPLKYDSEYSLPDHPVAGRHLGWSADIGAAEADWVFGENGSIVTGASTLYAIWENTVPVEFDSAGGSPVPTQYVPRGGYISEPVNPEKEGTTFRYWYTLSEDNFPEKWFFALDKTNGVGQTLTALWTDSVIEITGTQEQTCLGNKAAYRGDYGPLKDSVDDFTYERVKDPDGHTIGITITGVKGNPTNVRVPQGMYIPLFDNVDSPVEIYVEVLGISSSAFRGNTNLKKVTLSLRNVTITTGGLFSGCTSLVCVDLAATNMPVLPVDTFYGCSSLECVMLPKGVSEYGAAAFYGCSKLNGKWIPEGIRSIGSSTFRDCSSLTDIYIPDSVQSIGDKAFANCRNVRRISIGGPATIETRMLATGSEVLEELVIRGSVKHIGAQAFDSSMAMYEPNNINYWRNDTNGYHYTTGNARLVIEEGVESISSYAFANCDIFTEIVLPDSLTSIDSYAFQDCSRITTLEIPAGVSYLGFCAYENCDGLVDVVLPGTLKEIGASAFYDCDGISAPVLCEGIEKIGASAFKECSSLTTLYIPDSVQSIGDKAFANCRNVRRISIGGPETIEPKMLATGSEVLEELVIRGSVKHIGAQAFDSSKAMYQPNNINYWRNDTNGYHYTTGNARLIIEEGVESIDSYAFANCDIFTEIVLPDSLTSIDGYAFQDCSRITALEIPAGVSYLGVCAYENCDGLVDVVLPGTLKEIGASAFYDCDGIAAPVLCEGIEKIGASAFKECSSLTNLYIPDSVQSIGDKAFANCRNVRRISIGGPETIEPKMLATGSEVLEELVIRGSVKHIGGQAFDSSKAMYEPNNINYWRNDTNGYHYTTGNARLVIEEGVERIDSYAFVNCDIFTEIVLPDSLTSIDSYAFKDCSRITALEIPAGVSYLGVCAYENCDGLVDVVLPGTLKEIGASAFYDCDGISAPMLCEGIEKIGASAFKECSSLTDIYIPDSVQSIGDKAFANCRNVRRISIGGPETIEPRMLATGSEVLEELVIRGSVKHIGVQAFDSSMAMYQPNNINYWRNDTNGYHYTTGNARLVIKEGVERIDSYAFANCDIFTEIVFPDSLTSIDGYAFQDCSRISPLHIGASAPAVTGTAFNGCNSIDVYIAPENTAMQEYFSQRGHKIHILDEEDAFTVRLVLHANGGTFADGSADIAMDVPWLSAMPQVEIPTNGDYPFTGWYLDAECTRKFTENRMPAEGVELYAGWNMQRHMLTLLGNGGLVSRDGSMVESLVIPADAGGQPTADIAAFREGMIFSGWYLDAKCTRPFGGVMPDGDLTLYAGFVHVSANADYVFENGGAKLVNYTLVEYESSEIYLPETVNGMPLTSIGAYAFDGEGATKLVLPSSLSSMDENALAGMDSLQEIQVNPANAAYADVDGVLMNRARTHLLLYPAQHNVSYQLPDGVLAIAAHAFEGSCIRSIGFNQEIAEIGDYAFADTQLSRIQLPESLEKIGRCAFYNCRNITTLEAGQGLAEIGGLAFYGCGVPMYIYGPVEDCAIREYAYANGCSYNLYVLSLNYPDGMAKLRTVEAGSALQLPENPSVPENAEFTGWTRDQGHTEPWTNADVMPRSNLALYAHTQPIFAYESVQTATETLNPDTGDTIVQTETVLRLTRYLSRKSGAIVPDSIAGIKVGQIAAGCFGEYVISAEIPDCVSLIENGAFANSDVHIICTAGSAAHAYAQNGGLASSIPSRRISFHTNGGAEIADISAEVGAAIRLPVPVRSGCSAAGWYLDAALTEAVSLDENGLWIVPQKDAALYEAWTVEDAALANPAFTYRQDGSAITITGLAEDVTELVIPEVLHGLPVTGMEEGAFRAERELLRVQIPGTILKIPSSAFRSCSALESVVLGEGIAEIGENAFYGCSALQSLTLPASVQKAGANAFANSGLVELKLGAQFKLIYYNALDDCDALEAITVDAANPYYASPEGVLYDLVDSTLVKYPANRGGAEYAVDANCRAIGRNAFRGAAKLERVILHEDVWELGANAFFGCSALKHIPVMTSRYLATIPAGCFYGCNSLAEVEIPETIEVIDKNAFASCNLLSLAIVPETVVYIGSDAFTTGGITIQGVAGSVAEEFANANGLLFVDPDSTILPESIAISGSEGMLKRGQTLQLSAHILPETATLTDVYWQSSDVDVVRIIGDGTIRAVSDGTAEISVWTANGLHAETTIKVDPAVDVESITLDISEAEFAVRSSLQLAAGIMPAQASDSTVSWTSSDASIATVDANGLVTGKGAGKAVITAMSHNGLAATCSVTVLPLENGNVICGAQNGDRFAVGETLQLRSEAYLAEELSWTSSDVSIAAVDANGLVRFTGGGYATITATSIQDGVQASIELECLSASIFTLPANLAAIEDEAFVNLPMQYVIVPEGTASIGARAFAGCAGLYKIVLPASITFIAEDAFSGCGQLVIYAPEGSSAHAFALEQGIPFRADAGQP